MPQDLPCIAILGRLGTPQLACLRSWRRHGLRCVFLHAAERPLPPGVPALLGVRCVHLGPLRFDDPAWRAQLAQVMAQEAVDVLTCVSEPIGAALWQHRDAWPAGLRIAAARPQQVDVLASKWRQHALARAAGLDVLPMWQFGPRQRADVPAAHFPLVLRPDVARRTAPAFKVEVVHDAAALQRLVDGLRPYSQGVVAQPLVQGPNLLVHGWRAADGRAGHVVFRVDLKHGGLGVRLVPVAPDPALVAGCARMAETLGLTGVYHFDFIEDTRTGRASFLDLNPRLGGTTGKVLSAGYDEPLALLATLLPGGLPGAPVLAPRLHQAGGKHQALQALLATLRGRRTPADFPSTGRARVAAQLLRYLLTGRDEVFRAAAWRSALAFMLYQLARRRVPR